ncbi:MAG: hypothetical protein U0446_00290 [Dehalococcoidia bacterium]
MRAKLISTPVLAVALVTALLGAATASAASIQVGPSGKTFASGTVACATNPATGLLAPVVDAGLYQPKASTRATVSLNNVTVATVDAVTPSARVWLASGMNTVVVTLSKKVADSYAFTVQPDLCLPDTSGNTFSADGTLEYGASGKSYATVTPGCAWNSLTGRAQPFVNLFDNGTWVLNVSVNGVPLTQLSATRTHTPVFLAAGANIISVANGSLSTDYYIRDGGSGSCILP